MAKSKTEDAENVNTVIFMRYQKNTICNEHCTESGCARHVLICTTCGVNTIAFWRGLIRTKFRHKSMQ